MKRQRAIGVSDASEESGSLSRLWPAALTEGKAPLRLFWAVFWRASAVATTLFVFLFFTASPDMLLGSFIDVALTVVLVFGQCLFYASWIGLAGATFATELLRFGAWIVVHVVGAVLGDAAAVALALGIFGPIDLRGPGVHGGVDIVAFLILGFLAVAAVIGAIGGELLSGAFAVVLIVRHRRRATAGAAKLQLVPYETSHTPHKQINPTENRPAD